LINYLLLLDNSNFHYCEMSAIQQFHLVLVQFTTGKSASWGTASIWAHNNEKVQRISWLAARVPNNV